MAVAAKPPTCRHNIRELEWALADVEDWIVDGLPFWNNRLLGGTTSVGPFDGRRPRMSIMKPDEQRETAC